MPGVCGGAIDCACVADSGVINAAATPTGLFCSVVSSNQKVSLAHGINIAA
jgi:hypothetical protein